MPETTTGNGALGIDRSPGAGHKQLRHHDLPKPYADEAGEAGAEAGKFGTGNGGALLIHQ